MTELPNQDPSCKCILDTTKLENTRTWTSAQTPIYKTSILTSSRATEHYPYLPQLSYCSRAFVCDDGKTILSCISRRLDSDVLDRFKQDPLQHVALWTGCTVKMATQAYNPNSTAHDHFNVCAPPTRTRELTIS